jgi:CMP-N-acetylneuraminic acid synthetase
MSVCATIPIKSNSTRVPGKNFKHLNGKPLFQYIIDNCIQSECFDNIYVDTDSEEIKSYCFKNKVKWISRKPELTLDTANGNDVFHYDIEYIENTKNHDYYFQLYATAPFLSPTTIRECVNKLTHTSKYDSILTATEEYGWFWYNKQPVNYQPNILPRSQDVVPMIKETTGLYGITKQSYMRYRSRVGACPYFYILRDKKESIDIDTHIDFEFAEKYIPN